MHVVQRDPSSLTLHFLVVPIKPYKPLLLTHYQLQIPNADVVESLEDGSATLEESLKLWERGEELAKICQEWLDGAKKKLDSAKPAAK